MQKLHIKKQHNRYSIRNCNLSFSLNQRVHFNPLPVHIFDYVNANEKNNLHTNRSQKKMLRGAQGLLNKNRTIGDQVNKCIQLEKRRTELEAQEQEFDEDDRLELRKMQESIFGRQAVKGHPSEVGWNEAFLGKREGADLRAQIEKDFQNQPNVEDKLKSFDTYIHRKMIEFNKLPIKSNRKKKSKRKRNNSVQLEI